MTTTLPDADAREAEVVFAVVVVGRTVVVVGLVVVVGPTVVVVWLVVVRTVSEVVPVVEAT
jgi:hypothetical protein